MAKATKTNDITKTKDTETKKTQAKETKEKPETKKETRTGRDSHTAAFYVLKVLEQHSDMDHHLTQSQIIEYLKSDHGFDNIDRRAIGRANKFLRDELNCGVDFDKKGAWMDVRTFENSELQVLIDGVYGSRYISNTSSKKLIKKLASMGNEYFQETVKNNIVPLDNSSKTKNATLFYCVDTVNKAITENKQIEFDFLKFGPDRELHFHKHHQGSPYKMLIKNQKYYLMLHNKETNEMRFMRLDHISNMKITKEKRVPLKSVKGWENGFDPIKFASRPYMYADEAVKIDFNVDAEAFDYIIDALGYDMKIGTIEEQRGHKYRVTIFSSPKAMKYFALQYCDVVKIISPKSLVEDVKKSLTVARNSYFK